MRILLRYIANLPPSRRSAQEDLLGVRAMVILISTDAIRTTEAAQVRTGVKSGRLKLRGTPSVCDLRSFIRDSKGSATIEFVLWVPIIVALLMIVVDAATLYITHSEMWNVARDTARRLNTGQIKTEEDAETHAANAMGLRDLPYAFNATYDPDNGIEVVIALRVNDVSIIGYSPLSIIGGDMMARVVLRPDPDVKFGGSG